LAGEREGREKRGGVKRDCIPEKEEA